MQPISFWLFVSMARYSAVRINFELTESASLQTPNKQSGMAQLVEHLLACDRDRSWQMDFLQTSIQGVRERGFCFANPTR